MRQLRWLVAALIVLAAMHHAMTGLGFHGYVLTWGGAAFKAVNGGVIGWVISRYVIGLDISALAVEQRPLAALSQAILIGSFAVALATGA